MLLSMDIWWLLLLYSIGLLKAKPIYSVTITPSMSVLPLFSKVELNCVVQEDTDVYEVDWYKDKLKIDENTDTLDFDYIVENFTSKTFKLLIDKAGWFNTGMYRCKVCFNLKIKTCAFSNVANLTVYSMPASPKCTDVKRDVKEGDVITFGCFLHDGERSASKFELFVLYKNNKPGQKLASSTFNRLSHNITISGDLNNAVLCCTARFSIPINTIVNCTSGPLNVSYSPKVSLTDVTYSIGESINNPSNATITIEILSNPEAIVTWSNNYGLNGRVSCNSSGRSENSMHYMCKIYNVTNGTEVIVSADNYFGNISQLLTLVWDHKTYAEYSTTNGTTIKPVTTLGINNQSTENYNKDDINYGDYMFTITISVSLTSIGVVIISIVIIVIRKMKQLKNQKTMSVVGGSSTFNSTPQHIYETKLYEVNVVGASGSRDINEHDSETMRLKLPICLDLETDIINDKATGNLTYIDIDHPIIENNAGVTRTIERVEYTDIVHTHAKPTGTDNDKVEHESKISNTGKLICSQQCKFDNVLMNDNLLKCSLCQKQYHKPCLKIKSTTIPTVWLCPYCTAMPGTMSDMASNIVSLTAIVKEQQDMIERQQLTMQSILSKQLESDN